MIEVDVPSVLERIPALVYVYAVNHDTGESYFPYVSSYCSELFGFTAEEVMKDPKPLVNAIHEEWAAAYGAAVVESMTNLTPFDQQGRVRHVNGRVFHAHFKSMPRRVEETRDDGTVTNLTVWDGIVYDNTRQILNEENNRTKLQEMMDRNLQPVFEVDSRGNVIEWNQTMEKLTERTREEVIGVPVVGFMAEEERGKFAAFFPQGLKPTATEAASSSCTDEEEDQQEEQQWDFVFISKTQRKRVFLHSKCTTSRDINGGGRGLLCCCQDLTMVKEAQKQKDAALKLVDAERGLTEWLSHEVRNPLSVAMEAAVSLQEGGSSTSEDDNLSYSDLICESIRYIVDLLTNMLDLNKCLDGKIALYPSRCRIREEVMVPTFKIMGVNNDRVKLELMDGDEVVASVDKLRLRQVITNLVANALKFTDEGFVRVEVNETVGPQHKSLRISVGDSGCGIDPSGYKVLFSKWERLGSKSNGAGIGLCLSRSLVRAMGGDLTVNMEYNSGYKGNRGAQFIVEIPLSNISDEEPSRMPAFESLSAAVRASKAVKRRSSLGGGENGDLAVISSSCTQSPEKKARCSDASTSAKNDVVVRGQFHILIVDDDPMGRKLLRRRFARLFPEAQINEVESGEAALREAEKITYDIITVDHFMAVEDMNGEETIRALREQRHEDCCIVGISGNAKRDEHLSAGAQDFFQKPIPRDDVLMERLITKISPPSGWKVLCVDDVDLNIRFLRRRLRKISAPYFTSMEEAEKRWDITSRSTGEDAIALLKTERFDLVILDQHLGDGMTGTAVATFVREHGMNKEAVIVLNSGSIVRPSAEPELSPYNLHWPKPLPTTEKMRLDLCRELLDSKNAQQQQQQQPIATTSNAE